MDVLEKALLVDELKHLIVGLNNDKNSLFEIAKSIDGVKEIHNVNSHKELGKILASLHVMVDSDIKVACQQSCPTSAITFGNANDKHSAITKVRVESPNRGYAVLEQLHVLPNVTYLTKVRNSEEHEATKEKHAAKEA